MNNSETLSAFGTQDTARRQTNKQKNTTLKKLATRNAPKLVNMFSHIFEELKVEIIDLSNFQGILIMF